MRRLLPELSLVVAAVAVVEAAFLAGWLIVAPTVTLAVVCFVAADWDAPTPRRVHRDRGGHVRPLPRRDVG